MIPRPPDFSVCAHEEQAFTGKKKKKREKEGFSIVQFPKVRESEHYTPPVFISISHQIRSLADKSTSWHITSSLWRKLTRAGNSKRQGGGGEDEVFDKSEGEKGEGGGERWKEKD